MGFVNARAMASNPYRRLTAYLFLHRLRNQSSRPNFNEGSQAHRNLGPAEISQESVLKSPKILFVTDKFPWPLDGGGQIRSFQVLKCLARRYTVKFLSVCPETSAHEKAIAELGIETRTFRRRHNPLITSLRIAQSLVTKRPYPLPKNFSRSMLRAIQSELNDGNVDAVHFNHLDTAQYIDCLERRGSHIKVIVDTHNVFSSLYARMTHCQDRPIRKAYCWIQWRKMQKYEKSVLLKSDCVVVCSEVERELLSLWGVHNCIVVPNGVDTEFFNLNIPSRGAHDNPPHLVFMGAMDYLPNADGIRWFFRSVVPELNRSMSSYKLTIVGRNPPVDLLAWQQPGSIEFTGRVDDVRPYARSADVFFVPLRIAGGTRLKILEALAMELPVVSTRVGAEGLEFLDGVHLRLVDTAVEMAEAIVRLTKEPEHAREMARSGGEKLRERYAWRAVTVPLCTFYDKALLP